jgi:hypothetical protein
MPPVGTTALTLATALVFAAGCSSRTAPGEHVATTTSGTCGCCGTIVDIGPGQRCSDPKTCAMFCPSDASSDGPVEAPPDG